MEMSILTLKIIYFLSQTTWIGLSIVVSPEDHVLSVFSSEKSKNEVREWSPPRHRGHYGLRRREIQSVQGKVTHSNAHKL